MIMTPEELEAFLKLMQKYEVDTLEVNGAKINVKSKVKPLSAELKAAKQIPMQPTPEELLFYSSQAPVNDVYKYADPPPKKGKGNA